LALSVTLITCAGGGMLTQTEMNDLEGQFSELLDARSRLMKNSAYLIQVRVNSPDLKQKFNLEVYSEGDSVSFYSPGFLGKGTFKGIIKGDSLRFYLPSEKAYYSGLWYELTEPDLNYWRDVLQLIMDLLQGRMTPAGESVDDDLPYNLRSKHERNKIEGLGANWKWQFLFDGIRFDMAVYGWMKTILMVNFHIFDYQNEFPFFEFEKAYIYYDNQLQVKRGQERERYTSEIRLHFIRQKYNIEIPAEKFELEIPESAERINHLLPD
jgi:hypothetical protein